MPLEIVTVPCLRDNYAYLVHDAATGATCLVDAPEADPIAAALEARGWSLDAILITHHHDDHIAGVEALRRPTGARVVGAAADLHRLPPLDRAVAEGDEVGTGAMTARVLDAAGHTRGHVAYFFPGGPALFSADSLMVMGCGRLFEGTPAEMWASLHRMAGLPDATLVYSGHEYASANMRFALSLEPGNAALQARATEIETARAAGAPTVPARLDLEKATNPFLRAADPELRATLDLPFAFDKDVFAELRRRKDAF